LGVGVFPELAWHKQEKEHIMNQVGVEVEYGEQVEYGENKGTFQTLGDLEHNELVRDYIEGRGGMAAIAEAYNISSGTVFNHVKKHNKELEQQGECSLCKRVGSEYFQTKAKRGLVKLA